MFGKLVNVQATVQEHRAPTDESVRMLRELEAEARARVLGSVHLAGCRIDAVVTVERDDAMAEICLHARANVNGRDVVAQHRVHYADAVGYQAQIEALHKLRDEFAAELAAIILAPQWPRVIGDISGKYRK